MDGTRTQFRDIELQVLLLPSILFIHGFISTRSNSIDWNVDIKPIYDIRAVIVVLLSSNVPKLEVEFDCFPPTIHQVFQDGKLVSEKTMFD